RLADRRGGRGAADSLRRPAALRGRAVRGTGRDADRAAMGPFRLAGGARPRMSQPRASGYFRTRYAQDFALLDTRTQKVAFGAVWWVTVPSAAVVGALLGVIFGLPSLRLRGLYLAVSTLALHFIVIYLGNEYETKRGFSTGVVIDSPLADARAWYAVLFAAAAVAVLLALNLLRTKTGRAWHAIRGKEAVAEALGINITAYKLLAFVISSTMTSVAGCLFAYYRGFVSAEAFSLFLTIQYVAMVLIGGMGSILGAVLGAIFVTLFPYAIESMLASMPTP